MRQTKHNGVGPAVAAAIAVGALAMACSSPDAGPPVSASRPTTPRASPTTTASTDSNQGSVSISVEQLKHAGVVAKPPRQSPAITKSQALDLAEQYAGGDLETAETATLYRVTTTGHGRLGSDGEIDPTREDQLTWIVLVTGGLPVDIEPVRPTPHHSPREQEPTGPAGFLIVLINAESGHVMYGFSR
jgi:hypothetical protein